MRNSLHLCGALALLLSCGCKLYDKKPLDPALELAAITSFDLTTFKVERSKPNETPGPTPSVFDPTDGLNEDEVVALALTINSGLRAKRYGSVEARSHLVTAGLWPNPVVAFSIQPGVAGAPFFVSEAVWLVEVIRVWERWTRIDIAEAQAVQAEADIVAAEWALVADVRSRRFAVLAAEQTLTVLDEQVALRRRALELVKRGKELGESRALDVALTELETAEVERDRRRAQSELETARRELNRAIGVPPELVLPLTETGRPVTIAVYEDLTPDALDRRLLAGRFELRAKEADYTRSELDYKLALYGQLPSLGVGPSYQNQPEKTYYAGATFLFELPIFNQNQGEIAEKEAARERARLEYVALLQKLKADAHEALGQLRRAKLEIDAQERDVLPAADRAQKVLAQALELREIGMLEWITAQRRALESRREYVDSLLRYEDAVIRVEVATGTPLARAPR